MAGVRHPRIKGGFRAAFFLWLGLIASGLGFTASPQQQAPLPAPAAALARVHADPVWHALLHLHGGRPEVRDPGFILSLDDFSPERELEATLEALTGSQSAQAACRFPARALWLHEQGLLPPPDTQHCADWQEFQTKAPAERIALVFASEILSQPSSMMGHLFLKVEGRTQQGHAREHAISFYTDATTWNLPKLFYESMVEGKTGYFALTPFQDEVQKYASVEQRSLWTHRLSLDDTQLKRLQAHIHELRQSRITYFFQDYNCATLVRHMLAVANPAMLDDVTAWTTPKDVLRKARSIGLIDEASVQTPARWQARSLAASLPSSTVRYVVGAVERLDASTSLPSANTDEQHGFLSIMLAQSLLRYRDSLEQDIAPQARASRQAARREELFRLKAIQEARYPDLQINAETRRDPALSPPERQLGLGWLHRHDRDLMELRFLPVSHTLSDDNRQYFSENELRLFESSWLVDTRSGRPSLDRLTVYGVQTLLPWDGLTGGISGRFKLGVESQPAVRSEAKKALLIEGAVGRTWRVMDDADAYILLGGGWGWRGSGHLYGQPELGVVLREVWNMKSRISRQVVTHPLGEHKPSHIWSWTQSMYAPGGHTWELRWQRVRQKQEQTHELALAYKRLF